MEEEENKKIYEFGYLLSSRLTEENVLSLLEKIKKYFAENGAEILQESGPQKKTLAYPVKKQAMAYFGFFNFKVDPEEIAKIKEKIKYEEDLLRYLIVAPFLEVKKQDEAPRGYDNNNDEKNEESFGED